MSKTINYGIDLGTTNSAIARFLKGEVTVFKNPSDYGRSTLPSVVGYKKDKIIVGNAAKTLLEKDSKNVFGLFKRKMGTSESFKVKALNTSVTPVELSALVLKELKSFIPDANETLDAAVITIPASFDTTQSNATKEAGKLAGFKQVHLLQEPIAASLAYANMKKENDLQDGKWLVYDLGGGTFDVALVEIKNGEMSVLDHEGDNYLGGTDFDHLIVERLIVPYLEKQYDFSNLLESLTSATGKYNAKYYALLRRAEELKIALSSKDSEELVVDGFMDDTDEEVDCEITITRSDFNSIIKEYIDKSIDLVKQILAKRSLHPGDIKFVLMVGGSTYIPFVRERVGQSLKIAVNCDIDPTTAVAEGAAHYAGSKLKDVDQQDIKSKKSTIHIKEAYSKVSKETEELFSAKVTGDFQNHTYRIRRDDGGYDSGQKPLTERINEDLPLVENTYNYFTLSVYDRNGNLVQTNFDTIGINSGYGISGQPLPEDISLEIDDPENVGKTKLLPIFKKNDILPAVKTHARSLNKTISKGSDDRIVINVLEGPHYAPPKANKSIGYIEISGKQVTRDLQKGSEVEIKLTMSESRDLTVSAYFSMTDQEFKETFNPKVRHTPIHALKSDIYELEDQLSSEISEAETVDNYESAKELATIKKQVEALKNEAEILATDDVTDKRYQIEDKKRKLAQALGNATQDKRLAAARSQYLEVKSECLEAIDDAGNDSERQSFLMITSNETDVLNSSSHIKIEELTDQLQALLISILFKTPRFLVGMFGELAKNTIRMNDSVQARALVETGKIAIENQNWDRVREINSALMGLLPAAAQRSVNSKIGF